MSKLADFTVECLGVEYPDYFNGYGLGPRSDYSYCTYGIGNTEAEALEDCLEQMACSDTFDFTDDDERRIRAEYGEIDENTTAAEVCGCDCEEREEDFADFPAYWHVGVKWSVK